MGVDDYSRGAAGGWGTSAESQLGYAEFERKKRKKDQKERDDFAEKLKNSSGKSSSKEKGSFRSFLASMLVLAIVECYLDVTGLITTDGQRALISFGAVLALFFIWRYWKAVVIAIWSLAAGTLVWLWATGAL